MARARRALACALALAALAAPAAAQSLRTLHVDVLAMRTDKATLRVGEDLHLAIHAHVAEQVDALDELVVPDVGTMQLLGDERRVTRSTSGTDIVETLTLEPTVAGRFTFAGAYLDAVDARTKKRSRFSAPPLTIVVEPAGSAAGTPSGPGWPSVFALFGLGLLVTATAGAAVFLRRGRGDRRPTQNPSPVVVAPPAPRTARDAVADALHAYRNAPGGDALLHLRAALFAAAGATAGVTLRDALVASDDRNVRAALIAAERAAFGPAGARETASAELITATAAWLHPDAAAEQR